MIAYGRRNLLPAASKTASARAASPTESAAPFGTGHPFRAAKGTAAAGSSAETGSAAGPGTAAESTAARSGAAAKTAGPGTCTGTGGGIGTAAGSSGRPGPPHSRSHSRSEGSGGRRGWRTAGPPSKEEGTVEVIRAIIPAPVPPVTAGIGHDNDENNQDDDENNFQTSNLLCLEQLAVSFAAINGQRCLHRVHGGRRRDSKRHPQNFLP